jgi:hypothetical protein
MLGRNNLERGRDGINNSFRAHAGHSKYCNSSVYVGAYYASTGTCTVD